VYAIEMISGGLIYIPSFMKTGTGVRVILRCRLCNMRGFNVGIIDGGD
jgi:hypothetical protein